MSRIILAALGLCTALMLTPGVARSQSTKGDPLSVPAGDSLLCFVVPVVKPPRSARTALRFEQGDELKGDSRTISVTFDTAGNPLTLRDHVTNGDSPATLFIESFVVAFGPNGQVEGMRMKVDSRTREHGSIPDSLRTNGLRFTRPLTEPEKAHALQLAGWLWTHRCGARSTE
jgi:hypothetical protein